MPGKMKAQEVPEFTSDRLRLLRPHITPQIMALALNRVLTGESFFYHDKLREGFDRRDVKLALIVVLEINPREGLDNNEQGVLRGMDRGTFSTRMSRGELVP